MINRSYRTSLRLNFYTAQDSRSFSLVLASIFLMLEWSSKFTVSPLSSISNHTHHTVHTHVSRRILLLSHLFLVCLLLWLFLLFVFYRLCKYLLYFLNFCLSFLWDYLKSMRFQKIHFNIINNLRSKPTYSLLLLITTATTTDNVLVLVSFSLLSLTPPSSSLVFKHILSSLIRNQSQQGSSIVA